MKLQDAYFAETNTLGKWAKIGYNMNSTTNFNYGGSDVEASETKDGDVVTGSTLSNGWTAENKTNLNDCAKGVNWKISAATVDPKNASGTGTNATAASGASIAYTSEKLSDGCSALTPKFVEIAPEAKSN